MLTLEQLKQEVPGDTSRIGPDSDGLSESDLQRWQTEARDLIDGALAEAGLSIENARDGVVHASVGTYVGMKAMQSLGRDGQVDDLREEWRGYLDTWRNRPSVYVDSSSGVESNVDTDDGSRWVFRNNRTKPI